MIYERSKGFTIIELIVFIVVMGIVAGSLLLSINKSLQISGKTTSLQKANFLANARMQIILLNREVNGYSSLYDPCPSAAICTLLSTYAPANGFFVNTNITGNNPKVITVSVTGDSNVSITGNVYNYANN